ncbi:DUF1697 domain-containing protein [Maribacter sp. IgM3_T14_3]|uniref:DUF1697 domain-containing protein n=1 Tax=Maribacter sp. IgM3_T14_3 TaxID=3415140 RepID=UPI003C7057DE
MKTYIAFLRGINVSGKHKIPMAELRELCDSISLKEVKTYIQSGNIVFKSELQNTSELESLISKAILKSFGFEVPVIVKTTSQLRDILNDNPFESEDEIIRKQVYFVLLNDLPKISELTKFKVESYENEEFSISDSCIYLKCKVGYGKAKLNNNLIERKLKVLATTRNYRTMHKLLELSY